MPLMPKTLHTLQRHSIVDMLYRRRGFQPRLNIKISRPRAIHAPILSFENVLFHFRIRKLDN